MRIINRETRDGENINKTLITHSFKRILKLYYLLTIRKHFLLCNNKNSSMNKQWEAFIVIKIFSNIIVIIN